MSLKEDPAEDDAVSNCRRTSLQVTRPVDAEAPESYLVATALDNGVWRIPVPIMSLPIASTLVYAVECRHGLVLVDAGWDDDSSWSALTTGLRHVGLDITDVRGVVLTHHHPDHSGLVDRVRTTSGAWVAMHQADVDLVNLIHEQGGLEGQTAWEVEHLRRGGAPEADVEELARQGGMGGTRLPSLPDRALDDGELVDVPGRMMRVVWTPGHTPGHMCLYLEDGDSVFTGDHLLSESTPHVGVFEYPLGESDPLGDYLVSLDRVTRLARNRLLPAHERTVIDPVARVAAVVAHHEQRLTEVERVLTGGWHTLWAVAAQMAWSEPWDNMTIMSRQMAMAEAAAHVRHLFARGIVDTAASEDAVRYRRTDVGHVTAPTAEAASKLW